MQVVIIPYILLLLMLHTSGFAQKLWTGSQGIAWSDAKNWKPAGVPSVKDDVLLDNTILDADYTVILPDTAVAIRSLLIDPAAGRQVGLLLPPSSTASPGLYFDATGDALSIKSGGTFTNASGLVSGASISINGALRLENGGRYIHRSRSTHATIIARLSPGAGTEQGIVEFNVPGGSYPLSLSNRTYGGLVLSATASGGTQTYNASGTSPVAIGGNLEINAGVTLNMDFTRDITVSGDFVQRGGVFNVASQPNHNVVSIKGHIRQEAGVITETSSGTPVLELAGNLQQQVTMNGTLANSITVRVSNPAGIYLSGPLLLPYHLELLNGTIKTTAASLLSLSGSSRVTGASVHSFIDGPLRKYGYDDFEFPVGKQGDFAPVTITGTAGLVTDAFQAEYFLGNPQTAFGPGYEKPAIRRVSELEYWKVEQTAGTSLKKLTLYVGPYSQATALEKLVVSAWDPATATWTNAGNTFYNGIAMGTITSTALPDFGTFTLASTEDAQNPLPLATININATRRNGRIRIAWSIPNDIVTDHFEVERSVAGRLFSSVGSIPSIAGVTRYEDQVEEDGRMPVFFRVKLVARDGRAAYSRSIGMAGNALPLTRIRLLYTVVAQTARLSVMNPAEETVQCCITDRYGRLVSCLPQHLYAGTQEVVLNLPGLSRGLYILTITGRNGTTPGTQFFKL